MSDSEDNDETKRQGVLVDASKTKSKKTNKKGTKITSLKLIDTMKNIFFTDLGGIIRFCLLVLICFLIFTTFFLWKLCSHMVNVNHSVYAFFAVVIFEIAIISLLCHLAQELIMFDGYGFIKGPCTQGHQSCDEIYFNTWDPDSTVTFNKDQGYYYHFASREAPTIVFLHGNGDPACCWVDGFVDLLYRRFHCNIAAFEFRGYGRRSGEYVSYLLLDQIRDDIARQWAHLAIEIDGPMFLVGISLGGGFAWSTVDILVPSPTQLVLINTFADLNILFESLAGRALARLLSPFISRNISEYKVKVLQRFWKGPVLCVHTVDDVLFPPVQMLALRRHFKEDMLCDWQVFECPDGGHMGGPAIHQGWMDLIKFT